MTSVKNQRIEMKPKQTKPQEGDLRIYWIPQVPGKSFHAPVSTPMEGKKLLCILADYDIFQLKNKIKPDFCNAGGLTVFEDGEWCDWVDENGYDIDADEVTL